jgi:hypothetical protein
MKTNFPEVWQLFGPVSTKSAKIQQQIFLATLLFIQTLGDGAKGAKDTAIAVKYHYQLFM